MKNYHINIFYSEEDEAYIADIPDLKYCSTSGDTPQQHEFALGYWVASWE
jgi:predicted RNase H-like HicB family nuclease